MIDFYYEFPEGSKVFDQPVRYGLLRGWHPDHLDSYQHTLHNQCYTHAHRLWAENANGITLIRENGRDVHSKISPKEMTWIKLQAKELV